MYDCFPERPNTRHFQASQEELYYYVELRHATGEDVGPESAIKFAEDTVDHASLSRWLNEEVYVQFRSDRRR